MKDYKTKIEYYIAQNDKNNDVLDQLLPKFKVIANEIQQNTKTIPISNFFSKNHTSTSTNGNTKLNNSVINKNYCFFFFIRKKIKKKILINNYKKKENRYYEIIIISFKKYEEKINNSDDLNVKKLKGLFSSQEEFINFMNINLNFFQNIKVLLFELDPLEMQYNEKVLFKRKNSQIKNKQDIYIDVK